MNGTGKVVLAATPIGSADDASPALLRALEAADVIAAEDTRRFRALASRLRITPEADVVSYFDGNEAARAQQLADQAADGARIVVVTDAGMPGVSDPGFRLVQAAAERGVPVTAVPGPSAALTALAVSGLPSDRFCFEGFAPRKPGERARYLAGLADEPRTLIFYESPRRTAAFLAAAAEAFGPQRAAVVCRELTKTHEEIVRGDLAALMTWAEREILGEVTIVVAGAGAQARPSLDDATAQVLARAEAGERLAAAAQRVAQESGWGKSALYDAALARRKQDR